MSEVPQATPELCSLPSGANESAKAGTALVSFFLIYVAICKNI